MVSVNDHEAGTDRSQALARVGPFLAGDQPVLVESNLASFTDLVADCLRDLRRDDAPGDTSVLTVERAPQTWLTSPWELRRDGEPVGCPCPTRA